MALYVAVCVSQRSPLGALRLYWWWDVICPVCQPLSSYSYAIHTVGPPRPLIPVSRGGGQTAKQTGGWAASLFRRCSTRWAWRSISHLQRFQQCYQHEAAKQRAPRAGGKPGKYDIAQMREFRRAGNGVFRLSPRSEGGLGLFKVDFTSTSTITHLSYLTFRLSWVPLSSTLCFLGTSDHPVGVNLHRSSSLVFTNKYRKSLCNAFI